MLKDLKLSFKIAAGFGLIIVIAAALGLISVVNMNSAKVKADILSQEYMPEVKLFTDYGTYMNQAFLDFRTYGFTAESSFLTSGKEELNKAKNVLAQVDELLEKSLHLVKLKDSMDPLKNQMTAYEQMIADTETLNRTITDARSALDENGVKFMNNAQAFRKSLVEHLSTSGTAATNTDLVQDVRKLDAVASVIEMGNSIRIAVQKAQATRDMKIFSDSMGNFDEITKKMELMDTLVINDAEGKLVGDIGSAIAQYKAAAESLMGTWTQLDEIGVKRADASKSIAALVSDITNAGTDATSRLTQESSSGLALSTTVMIVGLILVVILGILTGLLVIRSITKPIQQVAQMLNEGSEQVSAASEQLSSASQQLAEANSELASSIQETSSTLEESASMVQQNNENTKQAALLAGQAKTSADRGNAEMKDMMGSMDEIKKSSDQISKIIKVIDEIAFQTNILALNAAVEAARAGEAGMGFAVVAEEVRNLAQRSAQAAKDTASIIENNIEMSGKGLDVARKVGESLGDITLQAKKVNELMDEIAAASQEQSQGISQINKAVSQMEKVTQQNASTAEESASASEQLNAQAETLKEMVMQLMKLINGKNSSTLKRSGVEKTSHGHDYGKGSRHTAHRRPHSSIAETEKEHRRPLSSNSEDIIPLAMDGDDF